ncbi:complement clr-like EGF-like domain-containing protein [Purpureocillium lilacinum]|uniref:Complement clr-like EGF-like domain-containing protein n=1 Tax=Purpureocillium lilacinum TaxID=33203 RepID=A0A179F1U9_PURLI|nr:complement clr-like EGF-like domain-containing protein [Purpureocillium lilacinum]OAQ59093.1 complement clr-like EGF-like domain-containing protein [Purpureocillium lilacinum]
MDRVTADLLCATRYACVRHGPWPPRRVGRRYHCTCRPGYERRAGAQRRHVRERGSGCGPLNGVVCSCLQRGVESARARVEVQVGTPVIIPRHPQSAACVLPFARWGQPMTSTAGFDCRRIWTSSCTTYRATLLCSATRNQSTRGVPLGTRTTGLYFVLHVCGQLVPTAQREKE